MHYWTAWQVLITYNAERRNKMELTIKSKDVYGRTLYYPACKRAELFAQLTNKTTLTPETLVIVKELGYNINIQQPTWEVEQ